ncbi:DUF481 domain-containing protein [Terriglobus aquaticus]|uniref:DUF481 domain-containing protein n=1 Tax=Terriglobus aquaticus TaxID=940139 RepID=A0ABW9KIE5_9BACT|nr:DUF481 domain-containing protein [Terriglobus aquaticus]
MRVWTDAAKVFGVLWVILCGAPAWAQAAAPAADVLTFVNGDRLTGKLLRGVNDTVVFHSDNVGDVTVPLSKVKELQTAGTFAVLRHGAPVKESQALKPQQIVVTAAGVVQSTSGTAQPAIPLKDVAYIVDGATYTKDLVHRAGPLDGWNGTVNLGTTFVQSTQHGGTVNVGGSLVRQVPVLTYFRARNKTTVNVQETYGTLTTPELPASDPTAAPTLASTVKTSIFHADGERDEYTSKRLYLLADTAFDHNFSQGLQLQQVYGAGFGFTPFSTPVHQLDLKADTHYEKQQFLTATSNQNLIGSTISESYRRAFPRKLTLTENFSFLPAWNNLDAYSGHLALGFTMPLLQRLSVNLNGTDDYLNNPSPGYRKNSVQFTTGLAYSLR